MSEASVEASRIGPSEVHELPAIQALVASAGLPVEGLADLRECLVKREGDQLVGAVGLDAFGDTGLLRSLVVHPERRGRGFGARLCRSLIGRAAELGLRRLYLLSLEDSFFRRLGFEACERSSVPDDLAASVQFGAGVCDTATCMLLELADREALQDRYPGNHCFGCGPRNANGLQLKSARVGDTCIAHFRPSSHHNAGPEAWLNGGIIATLLDCHGIFTAIADAYEREQRAFASAPLIWCVTGSLSVRYVRPTPIGGDVRLVARVASVSGRKTTVACTLYSGRTVCATADVEAVRVEEGWKTPQS